MKAWLLSHWPRGRWNRQRIGGIVVKVELNLAWWAWAVTWSRYTKYLHVGPVHVWLEVAYER